MNSLPSRPTRGRRSLRPVCLALVLFASFAAAIGLGSVPPARAQTVIWESYVVDLHLRDDGSFHIEETQTVDFDGGPFRFAFAEIPLTRVDDITNIEVWEIRDGTQVSYQRSRSEDPETFTIEETSSAVTITWYMPRTFDETRTFVLAYDVIGGLRVFDTEGGQNQQIWWTAISEDVTDIAPIEQAEFNLYLPTAVDPATVRIEGPGSDDPAEHSVDGLQFTWLESSLGQGDDLEVRIEFPAIVNAAIPGWQVEDDERRLREQDREAREALLKLIMAGAALLTGIAGGVGLFGLWYTRGRDPGVGLVADYLSEPPDDLPPGAAGALIDEHVNQRDIVATLTDLGHRGILSIQEKKDEGLFSRRDYEIELKQQTDGLREFEQTFVKAIMGSTEVGTKVRLGEAKTRFAGRVDAIEDQMYKELVTRGYFDVSPETTRSRYRKISSTAFVVGFIVLALLGGRIFGISGWIILPLLALAIVFGALSMLAKAMPRKTYGGAETAAKWRAFKRYLTDLDQNRATEGATALFDKYLPYAVAFGIERTWVHKFADAGAPAPEWYGGGTDWDPMTGGRTYRRRRGRGGFGGWGGWGTYTAGQDRDGGGGDFDLPGMPDFQGTSDRAGKSLGDMSSGLFDLFDLAGSAFESFGSSSSRSGGGGSRHRGFSGGGRSGGGGGGGRRGFG